MSDTTIKIAETPLPERIASAQQQWHTLQTQSQIYFAPIRHHSPACAFAVRALIETIRPDIILIEGPESFNRLLPSLLDPETQPPVAIMGQAELTLADQDEAQRAPYCAYFPFCDYSPEWQALLLGHQQHAELRFIDLPWAAQAALEHINIEDTEKADTHRSRSFHEERYLARSLFITKLAKQCGCRDHDELWEHLFEQRSIGDLADWQNLFWDTFVWCGLARLDYDPQQLQAEGNLQRESHMLAHIQTIKQHKPDAKLVVVTGGFHTLALIEGLSAVANTQFALTAQQQKQFEQQSKTQHQDHAWLIRYSYDRLDALNGYASGMPSPAFYQQVWQTLLLQSQLSPSSELKAQSPLLKNGFYHQQVIPTSTPDHRQQLAIRFLVEVADTLRKKGFDEAPGFLSVKQAAEQSFRLAEFRGHVWPGRYDLLDGLQSAFIKGSLDESQQELWQMITTCFSGYRLGKIPKGTTTPPIVTETYNRAKNLRFKLDDTLAKVSRLDIHRNQQHRLRSQFLHLLAFLEINFAQRLSGPDFITGHQSSLLFEEWRYAWTPVVEAQLITLSEKGSRLEQIALAKLLEMEQKLEAEGLNRSSSHVVSLLIQAALIGLYQQLPSLFTLLDRYINQDPNFDSLVACGHKLLHLWRARQLLELTEYTVIEQRLHQVIPQTFFCLSQLVQTDTQQQEQNFSALLSLRELIIFMAEVNQSIDYRADFYLHLDRLDGQLNHMPLLKGAVDALRYLGAYIDETLLINQLRQAFSLGSDPELAMGYLIGLMRTAPELILRIPLLTIELNQLLLEWDDERFIQVLPDLRFAFSQLTPKQNAELAHYIAETMNIESHSLTLFQTQFSQQQMLEALRLEQMLETHFTQQQLQGWLADDKGEE